MKLGPEFKMENIQEYFEQQRKMFNFQEEYKLNPREFDCVIYLGSRGYNSSSNSGATMGELNKNIGLGIRANSTISIATSHLWKKGIVKKRINNQEQRERFVNLTLKGERIYQRALEDLFS